MRKHIYVMLSWMLLWAFSSAAQTNFPPITDSHVIDDAHILSDGTRQSLDVILKQDMDTSGNQILVLTIPSLEGRDIEGYANDAYNHYNLGQKGSDNGVLLVIANKERRIRIEVGYGLEGVLPDALCGRIIDNEITPNFKEGNFDAGVTNGVHAILQAIKGTYRATSSGDGFPWWIPFLLVFGAMGVIILVAIFKSKGGGTGGGSGWGRGFYGGYYGGWSSNRWSGGGGSWGGGGGGWSGGGGFSGGGGASGSW